MPPVDPSINPNNQQDFTPVDPAFRPPTTPAPSPVINQAPPIATAMPGSESSSYGYGPSSPTSSDIKKANSPNSRDKNQFINLKEFPELEEIPEGDSETKKIITIGGLIVGGIFLTAIILFLVTKNKQKDPVTPVNPKENPTDPAEKPTDPPEKPTDPVEKPTDPVDPNKKLPENTATQKNISLEEGADINRLLEDYFAEIKNQETEFNFYDKNIDRLSLARFAERSKITIPYYVNEIVTSKYYFFMNLTFSSKNPKTVLILESNFSDYKKTEEVMKRWENYLSEDLKSFLLLGEDYDFIANAKNKTFTSSSKYPGGRYINFLNDGSVSLNYIVMRDKIVIANSFEAFESAIEYIKTREDL